MDLGPEADEAGGESSEEALRGVAPGGDDAVAARARAEIEARLFGGPPPPPAEPEVVGRYRIEGQIGAGGMGVVYRAHDPELDRHVAVKLLRSDTVGDELARQRMLREARSMARLAHPNVIHVYDVGIVDEQVFVAMELVDGVSLGSWLMTGSRPWLEVLERFLAAGEGLQAAHDAGLIHRDFKPENVLIAADGRVRVLDFGLARSADVEGDVTRGEPPVGDAGAEVEGGVDGESGGAPAEAGRTLGADLSGSLTRTGALLGTPRYMSRELFLGRPADERSDLFAYCVALYEGLYGRSPFAGDTMEAYLGAVVEGEVREPPSHVDVPPWIWPVLRRGLESDPEARYPSMASLLQALRPEGASPAAGSRRTLLLFGALGIGLLMVVGLALSQIWSNEQEGRGTGDGEGGDRPVLAAADPPASDPEGDPAGGQRASVTTGETSSTSGTTGSAGITGEATEAREATDTETVTTTAAASDGASSAGAETEGGAKGGARTNPIKWSGRRDWCYMDEDRYHLLLRMPKRRATIRDREGRCYRCRVEARASRVQRFQPDDCGHYQVCGPTPEEECG